MFAGIEHAGDDSAGGTYGFCCHMDAAEQRRLLAVITQDLEAARICGERGLRSLVRG